MQVTVINLDRSTERLQAFRDYNKHLSDVVRFAAVDGRRQDLAALIRAGIMQESMVSRFTAGALGNALSHFLLWEKAIAEDRMLTICEDDAIFGGDFERRAPALLGRLPERWDIVLWGWNFDAAMTLDLGATICVVFGDEERLTRNIEAFQNSTAESHPMRVRQAFGILAYSVSPKGAQALKDFCLPIRPMQLPLPWPEAGQKTVLKPLGLVPNGSLDVMMSLAYPQLQAFVAFPPLAVAKNEKHISTIVGDVPLRGIGGANVSA